MDRGDIMDAGEVVTVRPTTEGAQRPIAAQAIPMASLAGTEMSNRFCFWRGLSGRRYVFSVYDHDSADENSAPDYAEAVVIEAERRSDGSRRVLRVGCTGALPELVTTHWGRQVSNTGNERHVHLLAGNAAARRALVMDLFA